MGKLQENQKGFAALEAVLIMVIVGIVGFTGWFVWNAKKNTDKSLTSNNSTTPVINKKTNNQPADANSVWETATFDLVNASFKYPKNLKLTHEVNAGASPNTPFETFTLTAADKTTITLTGFHFQGGFSGDEPKTLVEDVITSTDKTNNREFSSIIYKNSNGVYDSAYVMDSTQTKYSAGQESQIFISSFSVKPKGANTARSQFSISISGQKYQTYKTLAEIKAMGAYKDIDKFLDSLDIPSAD